MDFVTHLPASGGYTSIVTFVDRLTKLVRFAPCHDTTDAKGVAQLLLQNVVRNFGVPRNIVSDRDPRFMSAMWRSVMQALRTMLLFSTSFHPQTDGQTERMHRVLE